jgi:hypothetical protein
MAISSVGWPSVRWVRCPVCQASGEMFPSSSPDPGCRLCLGDGMVMQRLDHPRHNRLHSGSRAVEGETEEDPPEAA